jgi:integrase/recombinase XerD
VSELLGLNREQYNGRGFTKALTKGGHIRDFVPVQTHAREVLEEWLAVGGEGKGPLFTTRSGERLSRVQMFLILRRIAAQANAHLSASERIQVSPHVLRHTFLRKLAEEKGVQYAKEASGYSMRKKRAATKATSTSGGT